MMHTRRVLGVAAATATVTGLLLPTQAAFATTTCVFSDNPTTKVSTLTADCTTDQSLPTVPDGWTIDGNGHTIIANAPFTGGAVIESASGTVGNTPPSMTVGHLTISGVPDGVDGILFDAAQGRLSHVTVQGGQYGVEADNTNGADFTTTGALVKVGRSTVSGYHEAGVFAHGDLKLGVLHAVIGTPGAASPQGVAGVLMTAGAHGSVKESQIALSDVNPATPAAYGAGVQIVKDDSLLPRRIEVKRNVFTGGNADFGISASNPAPAQKKLTVDSDCNLFRRNDSLTDDTYGVGVGQWENSSKTNVLVTNSTFKGNWNRKTGTISGTTVTAGPPNVLDQSISTCVPPAPTHVSALGGNRRSKVTWHAVAAPAYAPLRNYVVKAKTAGRPAVKKKVSAGTTSTVLKGLRNGHIYIVTVTARSNGGQATGKDHLYPTRMNLTAKPGIIHRGASSTLHGKLATRDPHGRLAKRKVAIWAKPKGGRWSRIDTVRTTSTGTFSERVRPHKLTSYKAVYGGRPDLASSAQTKVVVRG